MIRKVRMDAGLTQRAFSAQLGRPHNYIHRIEALECEVTVPELLAIARKLGKRPGAMLDQVEQLLR